MLTNVITTTPRILWITYHVFVEVEQGFDEVAVHDFRLSLEKTLLDEEGREMPDFFFIVAQSLQDPKEQRAVDLQVILLFKSTITEYWANFPGQNFTTLIVLIIILYFNVVKHFANTGRGILRHD